MRTALATLLCIAALLSGWGCDSGSRKAQDEGCSEARPCGDGQECVSGVCRPLVDAGDAKTRIKRREGIIGDYRLRCSDFR